METRNTMKWWFLSPFYLLLKGQLALITEQKIFIFLTLMTYLPKTKTQTDSSNLWTDPVCFKWLELKDWV